MLVDSHIHVGQYHQHYFSPSEVHSLMENLNVDYYAVSSTTICEENYQKVLSELNELISLDGDMILPVLWITPESLKGYIAWFLESGIKWRMLKVHPYLHQSDWDPEGNQFADVLEIAIELKIPILIHTGEDLCCSCDKYINLVETYPEVNFVFAHGLPILNALKLISLYNNAFVDTAFMEIKDIKTFIDAGLSHKILWGTDMFIPLHFYPKINAEKYYKQRLVGLSRICTQEQYEYVTFKNAKKIFSL